MKWRRLTQNLGEQTGVHRRKVLYTLGLLAFFSVLFYVRGSWFELHFTNYDDIKVAQFTDATTDLFRWEFFSMTEKGLYPTKFYNLMLLFPQKLYNWGRYALNFSKYWTYAPGQFFFTFAMLPLAYDYTSMKFFGRLPSLVFGCLALVLCWKALRNYSSSKGAAVSGSLVFGLSWQAIIYCMHMSNYEAIILIGFLSAMCLFPAICGEEKVRRWLFCSLALAVMSWFHYQAICCFAGIMLVFLVKNVLEKRPTVDIAIKVIVLCAAYAAIVSPLLLFANMDGTPTWNAGPNGEYLFANVKGFFPMTRFFAVNSWKTFQAMLSPVPLESRVSVVIVFFYAILFVYGTVKSLREYKSHSKLFYLTVFSLGIIIAEYGMVVLGRSTLSPTRHSNVMIPAYVLQIAQGAFYVLDRIRERQVRLAILGVCTVGLVVAFAGSYSSVKESRLDQFTEESVWTVFSQYEPDLVVDFNAGPMWYLTPYDYQRREIIDYRMDFYDRDYDSTNNNKILVVSGDSQISDDMRTDIVTFLLEKQYISEVQSQSLLTSEPVYEYSNPYYVDVDFYNVSAQAGNNLTYAVYTLPER